MNKNNPPLFIVGLPRSGTTLLSNILSTSSDLCVTPELWFFNYWVPKYKFLNLKNEAHLDFFLNKFLNSQRFFLLSISKEKVKEKIIREKESISFNRIFEIVMTVYREKQGKPKIGEKTPGQYKIIPYLLKNFPTSKVVCVVRDPRAIAASLINVPFGSNYVSLTAKRWKRYMQRLETIADNKNVHIVKYEKLITNFEEELLRIGAFLEIELNTEKARKNDGSSFTVVEREGWSKNHFKKAASPISTQSLHKWKDQLSDLQVAVIEKITQPLAERFGYTSQKKEVNGILLKQFMLKELLTFKLQNLLKNPNPFNRLPAWNKYIFELTRDIREKN